MLRSRQTWQLQGVASSLFVQGRRSSGRLHHKSKKTKKKKKGKKNCLHLLVTVRQQERHEWRRKLEINSKRFFFFCKRLVRVALCQCCQAAIYLFWSRSRFDLYIPAVRSFEIARESFYISSGGTLNAPRSQDRRADAAQMGSERNKGTRTTLQVTLTSLANKSSVTVTQPDSKEG